MTIKYAWPVVLIYCVKRMVRIYWVVEIRHFRSSPYDRQYIEETVNYEM